MACVGVFLGLVNISRADFSINLPGAGLAVGVSGLPGGKGQEDFLLWIQAFS
jgi:hypothetical protein